MVKKLFLSLGLASLLVSGTFACEVGGCTPGFWKQSQHFEEWETKLGTISRDASYADTFGVDLAPDVTLFEALWLKGNKDGLAQLVRTSTASLLNLNADLALVVDINGISITLERSTGIGILKTWVQLAFVGAMDVEELKDALDVANNAGCPL